MKALAITFRLVHRDEGVHLIMAPANTQHVYPTTDEHITEGLDCWCSPSYSRPCDECDDGCWKCQGGLIPLTHAEAEATDEPLIIVHNR